MRLTSMCYTKETVPDWELEHITEPELPKQSTEVDRPGAKREESCEIRESKLFPNE